MSHVTSSSSSASCDDLPESLRSHISEFGSLSGVNQRLESLQASERVHWAAETFGDHLVLSSSFGAQAAVMLHLVTQILPNIPVIVVDTGYLFPETYRFIDELTEKLSLNLKVARAEISAAWLEARYGKLWEKGLEGIEKYNHMMKVQPMQNTLRQLGATAWLAGLRRSQSGTRAALPVLALQNGRAKIHPIVDWTDRDIHRYLAQHNLPYHPLWHQGYLSIGDWHTSRPVSGDLTPEESRFFGLKRECGLHEGVQTNYEI